MYSNLKHRFLVSLLVAVPYAIGLALVFNWLGVEGFLLQFGFAFCLGFAWAAVSRFIYDNSFGELY